MTGIKCNMTVWNLFICKKRRYDCYNVSMEIKYKAILTLGIPLSFWKMMGYNNSIQLKIQNIIFNC